jgi:tRNA wybutosine-synthesizing protein 2
MEPKFQIIGDIILIKDAKYKDSAGELLRFHPRCRSVVFYRGIHGQFRRPDAELIAGETTETVHKENGCLFKLDIRKVMFCPGNLAERMRMSRVGTDEVVVDMFAGVGYFSIPIAVHSSPKRVLSIEKNKVAYDYLRENIKLNKVSTIEPILGDCAEKTPEGIADRVIMGYLDAHPYLRYGVRALKKGGLLHYHEAVPEAVMGRPVERLKEVAPDAEILAFRKIKKYAPGVWHTVVDAKIP